MKYLMIAKGFHFCENLFSGSIARVIFSNTVLLLVFELQLIHCHVTNNNSSDSVFTSFVCSVNNLCP